VALAGGGASSPQPRVAGKFPGFGSHRGGQSGWRPLGEWRVVVDAEGACASRSIFDLQSQPDGERVGEDRPMSAVCPLIASQQRAAKYRSLLDF
jgi:hypothetical protein